MQAIKVMASIFILSSVLVGCHTVKGAGQDIQQGGKAVSNASDSARQ